MDLGLVALIVNPLLIAVSTYILNKRKTQADVHKTNAEADGLEIENVQNLMKVYKIISDDLARDNTSLQAQILDLKKLHEHELDAERKSCAESLQLQGIVIKELSNTILIQKDAIAKLEAELKTNHNG